MMTCLDIEEWSLLCRHFEDFFEGLGSVETDDHEAAFASDSRSPCTTFEIARDGRFAAAMPLHEMSLIAVAVEFDREAAEVHLLGEGGASYTYRVPPQLLEQRNGLRMLRHAGRLRESGS